ncbi:MAG: methylenetetrahydrofolate reductase [Desulfobacteraceae bacterium]|nr:methylenetetrahydrofolate reductase [Desulfobacteraceae bacterium]MBC2755357.1 methylenetetrahydrofolate reductase [Desulfobacteraceae bacterium]
MSVANLYKDAGDKPIISFEFFRAKTEKAEQNLEKVLDLLSETKHDYMSVTFGAGGSTREGSYELIDKLKNDRGLNVVAYIAGIGLGPDDLTEVLDKFKNQGIETVFVIQGDEPQGDVAFQSHPDALAHATDLLAFIKDRYDFRLGAAGYPEGHINAESLEKDIEYAKLKQDNGAEYIVAQYFYDNRFFYDYVDRCRAIGVTIPIIPGIMPIYTVKLLEILTSVCGSSLPDDVRNGLDSIPADDKEGVVQFGIELATQQCRELLKHGVPGLHFYTMNRGKSVNGIVNTLQNEGLL